MTAAVSKTPILSVTIPLRTVSLSNLREHWSARSRRAKAQREAVGWHLVQYGVPELPVTVRLVRLAPRALDDDNLRGALKSVRDAVAQWLRADDADPRIAWDYAQEKTQGDPKQLLGIKGFGTPMFVRIAVSR